MARFFEPFCGDHYKARGFLPRRTLVLGESYYDKQPETNPLTPDFPTRMIKEQIGPGSPKPRRSAFYTKVATLFLGFPPRTTEERSRFWHSVAYYPYVQEPVGKTWGVRPTSEMWAAAGPDFLDVLKELNPEFVLVLGRGLWSNLPQKQMVPGPSVEGAVMCKTRIYAAGTRCRALAYGIWHPSWRRFRATEWRPFVVRAMALR